MCVTFFIGFAIRDADNIVNFNTRDIHLFFGIGTGMLCFAVHVIIFMYFMATSRWIHAASDKANLDEKKYADPSLKNKSKVLAYAMIAIVSMMLTMMAGASADLSVKLLPPTVHMFIAIFMIATNSYIAMLQYSLIKQQKNMMTTVLDILNNMPNITIITPAEKDNPEKTNQ